MVIVVMGAVRSDRDSLGRFLATNLGWEFADADTLAGSRTAKITERTVLRESATSAPVQALCGALQYWSYKWQDVVVSCPLLTEQERKLLSTRRAAVKFLCLNASERNAAGSPQPPTATSRAASPEPAKSNVLTVEASRGTSQIVADVISMLILNRRPPHARVG